MEELELLDAYWRAANYLSVGQIYLLDNPLLREPLGAEQIKPRLLGHFGTTPGLNFVYAHLNRAIRARDLSAIFITGPGHGGPGLVACSYLEGTYSELYPNIAENEDGLRALFRQFSFPGGIPRTSRRRHPARSTKEASSATRSPTPSAPPSTTPTCSSPAWSETARQRPGRLRPAGTRTSS
jgi:phosphoketolase